MTVLPGGVYLADIFESGTRPVAIVSGHELNYAERSTLSPELREELARDLDVDTAS